MAKKVRAPWSVNKPEVDKFETDYILDRRHRPGFWRFWRRLANKRARRISPDL